MSVSKLAPAFNADARRFFFDEIAKKLKDTYGVCLGGMSLSLLSEEEAEEQQLNTFINYLIPQTLSLDKGESLAHVGYTQQLEQQRRMLEMYWEWKNNYMTELFSRSVSV